jgi:hypothetical protein
MSNRSYEHNRRNTEGEGTPILPPKPLEELNLHKEDILSSKMPRESKHKARSGGEASTE